MAKSMLALALVLGLVGIVFLGQGLGLFPGSFMTGDPGWAVVGAVMLVIGIVLGAWALRLRRSGR
ncbi:MAG TPA: hypothetical protein VM470_07555 [Acidimicrobiia bacterium]|nr:hypothetical protein [Acidimicrobiia bacterium]